MHKLELFEAVRTDGKSDKMDLVIEDDGSVHFVVEGNLAMMILHFIKNPNPDSVNSLIAASEMYEKLQDGKAEIREITDPFEALRVVKEQMPDGPAKEEAINKLLEVISQKMKQNGASC
jgi:hypothetical protein